MENKYILIENYETIVYRNNYKYWLFIFYIVTAIISVIFLSIPWLLMIGYISILLFTVWSIYEYNFIKKNIPLLNINSEWILEEWNCFISWDNIKEILSDYEQNIVSIIPIDKEKIKLNKKSLFSNIEQIDILFYLKYYPLSAEDFMKNIEKYRW